MKLKIFFLSIFLIFSSAFAFSFTPGFEFGVGSGYVHYGDKKTRDRNSELGKGNQIVLTADARLILPLENNMLYLSLGGDSTFDGRWNGGHIFLVDYSFLLGFRIYPGLAGLVCSVDYALGRRTDFIDFDDYDETDSTEWGNGFRLGLGYDFSVHTNGFAPTLGAAWKSMPRGGSRDNLITVFLKFGKRRP